MATAFAALVSLQNTLTLIQNHPRHSFSFENQQIESLLSFVRCFIKLMKFFDRADGSIKEAAEAFERQIARATHAAEDVIESHVVDQIRAGSTLAGKRTSRFLLDLQKVIHGMHCVARKIIIVIKKGFKPEQPTFLATTSSTPLASEKNNRMVGFGDLLLRLLDRVTGVPSRRGIISILGMGGIGKTTLATNAFQHPCIVHYFDVRLWATVSQEFRVQKILTQLLSQIKEKTSFLSETPANISSVDELGEELYNSLLGRRYLIVLDDMWSVEVWDEMKFFFPDTNNRSRIVVTTRQSDVATQLGSLHFMVRFLDEDSSWNLFCGKTFGDEGCPPELQDVGKRIVKNCGGLPLSIVVVGGRLQNSSRTIEYWENVANDMNSMLDSGANEQCLDILSLSYKYLPARLKPCFIFLGVFPKDQEISMWELVNLWIGEGFIEQCENCKLEETALLYIWDLLGRNLISAYQSGVDGNWKCRVHDVLRELCLKIAVKDEFLAVVNTGRPTNRERRVVMKGRISHQPEILHASRSASIVRSLICEGGQVSFELKLLRVLNEVDTALLNQNNFQHLNLRYLKVDVLHRSCLPSSISLLWNLQTLIITGTCGSIIAPYEIWEMLQLGRIEVHSLCLVDPLPIHDSNQENDLVLKNLHTLSKVENFSLSEEVCRRIANNIELTVSYIDEESSYYCLDNLFCFKKLKILKCYFDGNAKWCGLTFPNSLTLLNLSGSRLGWEEVTIKVGSLPYLATLVLDRDSVSGPEWTPVEGGFPRLKHLIIGTCELVHWNADNSHFPVLEDVYLRGLSELDEFPSLRKIALGNCSASSSSSAMRMVVEQEELGNEELQLYASLEGDDETLEDFKQMVEEEGLISKNVHLSLDKWKSKGS